MNINELPKPVLDIAKRIHSMGRQYDGISVVRVAIAVNSDGVPLLWGKPYVIPLEPRLSMNFYLLKEKLGEENLQELLEVIANFA